MSRTYRKSSWIFTEDFHVWHKHRVRKFGASSIRHMEGIEWNWFFFSKKNRDHRQESWRGNVKQELHKTMRAKTKVALHKEVYDGRDDVVYPTKKIHSSDVWNWN